MPESVAPLSAVIRPRIIRELRERVCSAWPALHCERLLHPLLQLLLHPCPMPDSAPIAPYFFDDHFLAHFCAFIADSISWRTLPERCLHFFGSGTSAP